MTWRMQKFDLDKVFHKIQKGVYESFLRDQLGLTDKSFLYTFHQLTQEATNPNNSRETNPKNFGIDTIPPYPA